MHPIVNEIQNLPPQAQQEVINLVAALVKQQQHNPAIDSSKIGLVGCKNIVTPTQALACNKKL